MGITVWGGLRVVFGFRYDMEQVNTLVQQGRSACKIAVALSSRCTVAISERLSGGVFARICIELAITLFCN